MSQEVKRQAEYATYGILLGVLLASWCVYAAEDFGKVAFSCLLSSPRISVHEPVSIDMTFRNNLGVPITVDLGIERKQSFLFTIVAPDGNKRTFKLPVHGGFGPTGVVSIAAGGTYRQTFELANVYDFSVPGRYNIEIHFTGSVKDAQQQPVEIHPIQVLELTVNAVDEAKLRSTCSALLKRIEFAPSYPQAETAARALSTIDDTIAVPYLATATEYWHLAPITIQALQRIRDGRAIEALISMLQANSADIRALSRSALLGIAQQTQDGALRQRIHAAVAAADDRGR